MPQPASHRQTDRFIDPESSFRKLSTDFSIPPNYNQIRNLIKSDITTIRTQLRQDLADSTILRTIWAEATSKYKKRATELKNKNKTLPEECHIALIAYTLEVSSGTNLYQDFNTKCRGLTSEASWNSFPYKSFFALLVKSIHGIHNNPDVRVSTYYRGIRHKIQNLAVGNFVYPSQFLSCSVKSDMAKEFLGSTGTLITFKGSPLAAIGIADYSDFPSEEEILVFPWSCFKVTELKRGKLGDDLVLETFEAISAGLPYSGSYANKGYINDPKL